MTRPTVVVAAFDFDGTLTRADSVIPFMRRFVGPFAFAIGLARRPRGLIRAALSRDRSLVREIATEIVFSRRSYAEVVEHAAEHAAHLFDQGLRDDTVARLRWHLQEGHRVVIVSASYDTYLRPLADRFGTVDVVATRLDTVDGVCTGRLVGANCRGPEKVRRLAEWLDAVGLHRDHVDLWAYGDSPGDRDLLAWADRPCWVTTPLASLAPSN